MAVNRIRGAFAVPRKGETFELRAGLVYVRLWHLWMR
jgi:AP-1 complex subunit beta-1